MKAFFRHIPVTTRFKWTGLDLEKTGRYWARCGRREFMFSGNEVVLIEDELEDDWTIPFPNYYFNSSP